MMKKNTRKLLFFFLLLIIFAIIFFIFKNEMEKERSEDTNVGFISEKTVLPSPDRIIYKNKNDKYIIVNSPSNAISQIYSELYNRVTGTINGKIYSEEEITQMQSECSFIEFDYNKKSKNYIFLLEGNGFGIIKRNENGGQVIQIGLSYINDLKEKMDYYTRNLSKYDFNKEYNYFSKNKISEIPNTLGFNQVKQGVFQKMIKYDEKEYKNILEKLNFDLEKEIINIDFDNQIAIITISKYEIKNITQNIGNIKYEFGNKQNQYLVNLLVVSEVVNTNCIYYKMLETSDNTIISNNIPTGNNIITNTNSNNINKDKYALDYCIENSKYYAIKENKKIEIISIEKACDIADIEAQNKKYQYQSWKSEFYTRGKNKNESGSAELIYDLSDISRVYHWKENWKKGEYKNIIMWKVRLFDENDPLTSLYIYINAVNGEIIGAGSISD